MEINPIYAAYAKDHGCTPAEMLAYDQEAWPGGCMTGFILWISKKEREFKTVSPDSFLHGNIVNHYAWAAFLCKGE